MDPIAEAEAWDCTFETGRDFFGDLPAMGVVLDEYNRADAAAIEEAWHRLGHIFLNNRRPDLHRKAWALMKFGEPGCR
jgi:hypothetical protein